MAILSEPNIRVAFERSNIEASYRGYQGRVLEGTLSKVSLPSSAVLALSQVEMSLKADGSSMGSRSMLLIVFNSGLAMSEEKGLLSKRIELQTFSYKKISAVFPDEKQHDLNRGEMAIQGMVGGSIPSFRIGWYWSNRGTSAGDAAIERDRILNVIQRAMKGDWTVPSSVPADTELTGSPAISRHSEGGVPLDVTAAGARDPAAEDLPSMKQHLLDWTEGLFREAGIAPVEEHVESVARTAAAGLFVSRVVAYADSRPLPALQGYCRSLPGDLPDRFDQFDEIYATWIRLNTEADARTQEPSDPTYTRLRKRLITVINETIDHCLEDSRGSFLDGIRQDYG